MRNNQPPKLGALTNGAPTLSDRLENIINLATKTELNSTPSTAQQQLAANPSYSTILTTSSASLSGVNEHSPLESSLEVEDNDTFNIKLNNNYKRGNSRRQKLAISVFIGSLIVSTVLLIVGTTGGSIIGSDTESSSSDGEATFSPSRHTKPPKPDFAAPATSFPTKSPTKSPTALATFSPTATPNSDPTTPSPTKRPTPSPTHFPTPSPTISPTRRPTPSPTQFPTPLQTPSPTQRPTPLPTQSPTPTPTLFPTLFPTPPTTPAPVAATPPTLSPIVIDLSSTAGIRQAEEIVTRTCATLVPTSGTTKVGMCIGTNNHARCNRDGTVFTDTPGEQGFLVGSNNIIRNCGGTCLCSDFALSEDANPCGPGTNTCELTTATFPPT